MEHVPATTPSVETINDLFSAVESKFPTAWAKDRWYLTTIGALIGSGKPSLCGDLYSYLVGKPEYITPTQRQQLVRRMREAIIKCIILNGIPSAIEAILSVAAREKDEDKDYSFSREHWQRDAENEARALHRLRTTYRADFDRIMSRFDAHKDLPMISTEISYGLFLADEQILDMAEAELVILPAIMCQNLYTETLWHLRSCVRAGVHPSDVEVVQQCIELIAQFAKRTLERIARVTDIRDELSHVS